jgi:hypothetical protein
MKNISIFYSKMEKYVKELYFKNNLNNINVVFLRWITSNKNIKISLVF